MSEAADIERLFAQAVTSTNLFTKLSLGGFPIGYIHHCEYRNDVRECEVVMVGGVFAHVEYELWRPAREPTAIDISPDRTPFPPARRLIVGANQATGFVSGINSAPCNRDACKSIVGGIACPKGHAAGLIHYDAQFKIEIDSLVPFLYSDEEEKRAVVNGDEDIEYFSSQTLELTKPYPMEVLDRNENPAFGVFSIDRFSASRKNAQGRVLLAYGPDWIGDAPRIEIRRYGRKIATARVTVIDQVHRA
jgi:hypothetical protein